MQNYLLRKPFITPLIHWIYIIIANEKRRFNKKKGDNLFQINDSNRLINYYSSQNDFFPLTLVFLAEIL